ncbi:MAG: Radical domain protein [Candidatus Berkelbacteria bacterium]|nr:Radical domain protein [Candidatus Berkelbacteria bacterium]
MKVAIVNPPAINGEKFVREGRCEQRASSFQYLMVPISLPSIAGLLRDKGFEVKVIDCMAEEFDSATTLNEIKKFKPRLAIINFSTATFVADKDFTIELKKSLPKTHLSGIGVHVSSLPEETLIETALDSIIRNEPEMTALELAQTLKGKEKFGKIKGISYRGNPTFVNNPSRPFIENLDLLPFPARDLLKNDKYKMPIYNRPYTLVITARGCPNNCSFCTANIYYGTKIRMRSANNVLDEVEEILKVHKIKDITFWADTFTFDRKYVLDICAGIKERNLKFRWMCNARVDRVDLVLLKIMQKSGCQIISYGVESGDQKILNHIGKNITLKKIKHAFELTRKAKIESAAHIIFGLPGETEDTIKQTIKFVKEINPDYIQFYSAIPFPGTRFYDEASKKGWITSKNWEDYELGKNIISTPELSKEALGMWRRRAYLSFYLRPIYIWGRLKKFVKKPRDFFPFVKQAISFIFDWVEK